MKGCCIATLFYLGNRQPGAKVCEVLNEINNNLHSFLLNKKKFVYVHNYL